MSKIHPEELTLSRNTTLGCPIEQFIEETPFLISDKQKEAKLIFTLSQLKLSGTFFSLHPDYMEYLPQLVTILCRQENPSISKDDKITMLAHTLNPQNIPGNIQHLTLTNTATFQALQGLRWLVAIGFDPSAKDYNGFNTVEKLATTKDMPQLYPEMIATLIAPKESTIRLCDERHHCSNLRILGGKEAHAVKELEGLEEKEALANLIAFHVRKSTIQPSEFASKTPGAFYETLQNIFLDPNRTEQLINTFVEQHTTYDKDTLNQQIKSLGANSRVEELDDIPPSTETHSPRISQNRNGNCCIIS